MPTYSTIYAFGDSLSDAGDLSLATVGIIPVSPPYYQEHYGAASGSVFSNGPTWVQDLSVALGLGTLAPSLAGGNDFAYGGAETGPTPQNAGNTQVQSISLPSQITQFQSKVPAPAANALYTVSIGANDLLDILGNTALTAQQQTADIDASVANEITFVKQLAADGAKNLLVLDVPDLGKTPTVLQGEANGSGVPSAAFDAEASGLTAQYNADLTTQLAGITSIDASVIDAYRLIDAAVATPAAYALTNVTSPVWSGNYTALSSGKLAATGTAAQDQYLFWDHLHPTETGHQAIATAAEQLLGGAASSITRFYGNVLQRQPVAAEVAYWSTEVSSGALTLQQVDYAIATSAEAKAGVVPVVDLYTALGRAPDAAGLQAWVHILQGGQSLTAIAGGFLASAEGQAIYGAAPDASPAANTAFVDALYQEVLGRTADPAGAQGWLSLLGSGSLTPAQVLVDFVRSPEAQARDATPVTNFLLAAGNGVADYGGTLPAGSNVTTVDGFSLGTADKLQFLADGAASPPLTALGGAFGSGPGGTGQTDLTATAAAGILTFSGSAASAATLPQLIAAAGSMLDEFAAPAGRAAAFQHGGSTYVIETPAAPGAGGVFSLAADHVFDLAGVTGANSLGTDGTAHPHAILV